MALGHGMNHIETGYLMTLIQSFKNDTCCMDHMGDGILLVDKRSGETSHDVVSRIRDRFMVKKVGHAGTLDPFATGLLVILTGQGTKLSPYLLRDKKRYIATMRLGTETDTLDLTGRIMNNRPVPALDLNSAREGARAFVGKIVQAPPAFSALKYRGKRAYQYARKGLPVQLEERQVRIYDLDILSVDLPDVTFEVSCSGGTYIRSLAADLGLRLGPGAHLRTLRRLSSGPFEVEDAIDSGMLDGPWPDDPFQRAMKPLAGALPQMRTVEIDGSMAEKVRNGHQPEWKEVAAGLNASGPPSGLMKLTHKEALIAILSLDRSQGNRGVSAKIMRVFR